MLNINFRELNNLEYTNLIQQLTEITDRNNILLNEPMKKHTTFKLGGPVDIFITPQSYQEVADLVKLLNNQQVPYFILGNGSNLIVRDGGIRGVVINLLDNFKNLSVDGNVITAQAGIEMKDLSAFAQQNGLTGLEFCCGIPGSVGGGVTMNAGAYIGEMSDVFKSCTVCDKNGNVFTIEKQNMDFGYRKTVIQGKGYVALEASFELKAGNKEEILKTIEELNEKRSQKQPLELPSAGSVFKRPVGYYAGKLIQDAGLRGFRIGGAAVSDKHTGFIVNVGDAATADVLAVIKHVQDTVKEKFGVSLETEVKIIGQD